MIPWTPAPIAIFKNSENKDAAKVFVDYYLSKEGQEALREADARVMARGDVDGSVRDRNRRYHEADQAGCTLIWL